MTSEAIMSAQSVTSTSRLSYHAQTRASVSPDRQAGVLRAKRRLDVACVLLTLPLWLPCMVLITVWIKLVSRGPVFFRQERIGYRGRHFMILKFRSMKVNADTCMHEHHTEHLIRSNSPMTKLDATDPRIIAGGRILRATGLDELPQLLNVLRGEMSLVGPRPCLPREFARYDGRQRRRVIVPPGLTGYWQVNGKNRTTFNRMIDLDLLYTKRMGIRLDLWIMLCTVPALLVQLIETRSKAGNVAPEAAGGKATPASQGD